jgi:preprotein translocase subunit SecG
MFVYIVTAIHVLVSLFLIIVVLLQSGKGADLAGLFGGAGSQTAFGPRGAANALTKATIVLAALFMATSITLSIMATRLHPTGSGSVLSGEEQTTEQPAPAQQQQQQQQPQTQQPAEGNAPVQQPPAEKPKQ